MGFSFGFGSNNSKNSFSGTDNTQQNQTYSQTSTPTNPQWVTDTGWGLNNRMTDLANNTDPLSYVPGASANQTAAYGGAAALGGNGGAFTTAQGMAQGAGDTSAVTGLAGTPAQMVDPSIMWSQMPQVTAAAGADSYGRYFNPYLSDVVNTTLKDFDVNAGQTRAQQALDMAGSGAFGGSGAAITQSQTEGQLARARAAADANLRSQGYTASMGYGMQDADRGLAAQTTNAGNELARQEANQAAINGVNTGNADRTLANKTASGNLLLQALGQQGTAATQMAGIASGADANSRANVATQLGAGQDQRSIDQERAQAPLTMQDWLVQNFSNLPLSLFHGENQNGTQDTTGTETQSGTSNGKTTGFNFGFKS
jgi:hypothetical protein